MTKNPIWVTNLSVNEDPNDDMVKHGINMYVDSFDMIFNACFDSKGVSEGGDFEVDAEVGARSCGYFEAMNPIQHTRNTLNIA
jgi:hypothetical protein